MEEVSALIAILRKGVRPDAEKAARSLRKLIGKDARALDAHCGSVLKLVMADQDLRVRWNLIQILGKLPLKRAQRSVAVDWLFERLSDVSPFTRTFALQAVFDLSREDEALRGRCLPIALEFEENGTAAMRARARKLLHGHDGGV